MADKITAYAQSIGTSLLIGSSLLLAGCATATPPTNAVATAGTAVNQAIDAKAAQHAPLELRLATEKLDRAQSALNEEDHEAARRLAEQARADARLAEANARSASEQQEAQAVEQTIDVLEREADRNTPGLDPTRVK